MASLRKQVSRSNPEKYEAVVALLHQQRNEDTLMTSEAKSRVSKKEELLKRWQCHKCEGGTLVLRFFDHPISGMRYYRKCTKCPHKTKMQGYTEKVEGLHEEDVVEK